MVIPCPACGRKNRVPAGHLADTGKCGACHSGIPPRSTPIDVDPARFDEIVRAATVPILVDFWAAWCAPCRMLAPTVEAVAEKYAGNARVVKLNVDDNPSVSQRFGIKGIPTLILFKNGHEEERVVGATSEAAISKMIEKHVSAATAA